MKLIKRLFKSNSTFSLPVGTIIATCQKNCPPGWLPCDGKQFKQENYQQLYNILGKDTTPNLSGKVLLGVGKAESEKDYSLLDSGGAEECSLTPEQMPPHVHQMAFSLGLGGDGWAGSYEDGSYFTNCQNAIDQLNPREGDVFGTWNAGGIRSNPGEDPHKYKVKPHSSMQPYFVINYIIYTGKND